MHSKGNLSVCDDYCYYCLFPHLPSHQSVSSLAKAISAVSLCPRGLEKCVLGDNKYLGGRGRRTKTERNVLGFQALLWRPSHKQNRAA